MEAKFDLSLCCIQQLNTDMVSEGKEVALCACCSYFTYLKAEFLNLLCCCCLKKSGGNSSEYLLLSVLAVHCVLYSPFDSPWLNLLIEFLGSLTEVLHCSFSCIGLSGKKAQSLKGKSRRVWDYIRSCLLISCTSDDTQKQNLDLPQISQVLNRQKLKKCPLL